MNSTLNTSEILGWLMEEDSRRLNQLWEAADNSRRRSVGDAVHLRGLIEISSHCSRQCAYCGLRAGNRDLPRYRMKPNEILAAARQARDFKFGTVVLQAGEDPALTLDAVGSVIRDIKTQTGLAVTLSLGERSLAELRAWRLAGADRYLLRFETSDRALFDMIHPGPAGRTANRVALLRHIKTLGYETGSGIMVGLPGQTYASLARDILLFKELDLDMIGIGPFIPHPQTPLGQLPSDHELSLAGEIPPGELIVYKTVALTRLVCPEANIPATTALATLNKVNGRQLALQRGANVVMPNLTPLEYRRRYEIYPGKTSVDEAGAPYNASLRDSITAMGRHIGSGPGGRVNPPLNLAA